LDEAVVGSAVDAVRRFLSHDLGRRVTSAEARHACRRETPVTCAMADGTPIEGFFDLPFEEGGHWAGVDFKTDRTFDSVAEVGYRRQVALYAEAIARATRAKVSSALVKL